MRAIETPHLEKVIECLSVGVRYVLAKRYGLDGADPATLVEFSRELGLSRERVETVGDDHT